MNEQAIIQRAEIIIKDSCVKNCELIISGKTVIIKEGKVISIEE